MLVALVGVVVWWRFDGGNGELAERPPGGSEETVVESMVPESETAVPSMATMTGWVDGFDDNGHGWELSSGNISRSFVDGHYEIDLSIGGQAVSTIAEEGGEFTDLEYSGCGSLVKGQPESGYGLVFRRRDARNYYIFAVNGLSQWNVWALEDGAWRELRRPGELWTPAEAIDATGVNQLSVRAIGDSITATVNGVELVTLRDATFSTGAVGFYAASSRTATAPRTRVRFDDAQTEVLPAPRSRRPFDGSLEGRRTSLLASRQMRRSLARDCPSSDDLRQGGA